MNITISEGLAQRLLNYLATRPISEALPVFNELGLAVQAAVKGVDIEVPQGAPEKEPEKDKPVSKKEKK